MMEITIKIATMMVVIVVGLMLIPMNVRNVNVYVILNMLVMDSVMIVITIKIVAMMLVTAVDSISIQITVMNVYALNKPKQSA